MSDPMGGVASVSARLNEIQARVAAITGDAIVPSGVSGVYVTGAQATGRASTGPAFAAVLADADAGAAGGRGVAPAGGLPGGVVSAAWAIPWLDGAGPAPRAARVATGGTAALGAGVSAAEPAGAASTGIISTSGGSAAAVDNPLTAVWPVRGRISQHYGPTSSKYSAPKTVDGVTYPHFHDGIDIAAPTGRPVKAIADGKVVFAGTYPDGARVVRIKHADGSISLYAHLGHGLDVRKGDKVQAGQQIGVVGMTGRTTGPHLHLELLVHGRDSDPERALDRGRLPGARNGTIDESVLGASAPDPSTNAALAAFDRVADKIPYAAEIRDAAVRAGVDPLLFASLVKAESGFRPKAVSRCGAQGLCQLMPATARAMGVTDPFDPKQNLGAGARYLARNLHIYGRVDLALAAYQAGKGAVARAGGVPDSPTTRGYIRHILASWAGYREAAR